MNQTETKYVYYHDCRVLGDNTKLPRALMADSNSEFILYYQHKCPFCSQTAGEIEYAPGVMPDPNGGWFVNTNIAERLHDA